MHTLNDQQGDYKQSYVGMKMVVYSDQSSDQGGMTAGVRTALRSHALHRVICYDKAKVAAELHRHGLDPESASQIARGITNGFPIVIDDTDGQPIRSVLLHLLDQHRRPKKGMKGPRSLNSAFAAAYDLCHFLDHLDELAITFDQTIDQEVVDGFAEAQSLAPSAWTGRKLTKSTIARRTASVAAFCASRHFKEIGHADFSARNVPAYGEEGEPGIHPLTADDWNKLKVELGPKPSEMLDKRPCVMRLIAEWGLWTAGRRTEITTLPLACILEHADFADSSADNRARRIRVYDTKGRRPRDLTVPVGLLRETLLYIRTERAKALSSGDVVEHGRLFVRPVGWRQPGEPITPPVVSRRFAAAVARSTLTRRSLETGGHGRSSRRYVFHDLRHTAAVWFYIAFTKAGLPKPWKLVQGRLGHLNIETTERKYLSFVDEFEADVADLLSADYDDYAGA